MYFAMGGCARSTKSPVVAGVLWAAYVCVMAPRVCKSRGLETRSVHIEM